MSTKDIETLNRMVIETQDVLESQDFRAVFQSSIDIGFYLLNQRFENCIQAVSKPEDHDNPQIKVPFAKLLPEICKDLHEAHRSSINDAGSSLLLRHLLCSEILDCFAANIYEEFCNPATSFNS